MIAIEECPICKSKDLQNYLRCHDYTVSHETFQLRQCPSCKLTITSPRPETNKLGDYYKSEEYISHSGKSSGGLGFLYKTARSFSINWKYSRIRRFHKDGRILDFGCGTGEFLNKMKSTGWAIEGLEVSDSARAKSETLNGQKVMTSIDQAGDKKFDVITAWHVIEHVPDLLKTVITLKSLLTKDGTIFIAVPNYESPDAEMYKEFWAGYDVPRHLWHFSKQSIDALFKAADLKLIDTMPMKLDAYYVSMLSEKYKNNNTLTLRQMIGGFISGLKSNFKARNNLSYSSLIYVAKINES